MLPIQPLLELGTLLLTYYYMVVIAAGEAHDEFGTEEETGLADAVDVGYCIYILHSLIKLFRVCKGTHQSQPIQQHNLMRTGKLCR